MSILRSLLLVGVLLLSNSLVRAETPSVTEPLAHSLPGGAIAFAEFSGLDKFIDRIENSAVLQAILESDEFQQYKNSPEYRKANSARVIAELMLGNNLWDVAEQLLGGRMGLAIYPASDGGSEPEGVFLLRAADPAILKRLRAWLQPVLTLASKEIDVNALCEGVKAFGTEESGYIAWHADWIMGSQQRERFDQTLGLLGNDTEAETTLAKQENYASMTSTLGAEHLFHLFVNTGVLADATGGRFGLPEKWEDGFASFLFGGIVELATRSPFAGFAIDASDNDISITAGIAGDPHTLEEPWDLFFANSETGTRPLPRPDGFIGGFSFFRDFGRWYQSREEILQEHLLAGFDKFETDLGNLLPGKDFGQDVLPLIGNTITFVSAKQTYDHLDGEPGLKLPGFALIIELADPEGGADLFQLFFQTFSAILNFQAGQEGRQPWVLDMEMYNDTKVSFGRYLDKPTGDRLPLVTNFRPASARVNDKFILSTSLELCRNLVDELKKPASDARSPQNIDLLVEFDALADLAESNAGALRASQIQKGASPEKAKSDIDGLIGLMRLLESLTVDSKPEGDMFRIQIKGSWK